MKNTTWEDRFDREFSYVGWVSEHKDRTLNFIRRELERERKEAYEKGYKNGYDTGYDAGGRDDYLDRDPITETVYEY